MRVVIEKFYDDLGAEIGELVIESDGMQFIVRTLMVATKNKTGVNDTILGYYPSIASAVKAIVRMKVMESTCTTLSELLQDVLRIEAYIHERITV